MAKKFIDGLPIFRGEGAVGETAGGRSALGLTRKSNRVRMSVDGNAGLDRNLEELLKEMLVGAPITALMDANEEART